MNPPGESSGFQIVGQASPCQNPKLPTSWPEGERTVQCGWRLGRVFSATEPLPLPMGKPQKSGEEAIESETWNETAPGRGPGASPTQSFASFTVKFAQTITSEAAVTLQPPAPEQPPPQPVKLELASGWALSATR